MFDLNVFREVEPWKKPYHITRALLAKAYLKLVPNTKIIGITGSVGKTLTQNAICAVLSQKYRVVIGNDNLDPTFRIPQTILKTKPWDNYLILEYGVEHPGDMDYYLSIVKPKIAVITIVAPTHTKYFKDEKGVFEQKVKLVQSLNKNSEAVLNADDKKVSQMVLKTRARVFLYGQKSKDGIKISHFSQNLKGAKFRLHYSGQKATVNWKIVGKHQLTSAYAAATVGIICNLTLKQIAKGLSATKVPAHRLNIVSAGKLNILDDTYNSSPKAAEQSINTLVALSKNKQKIAVIGEMKDLGKLSSQSHTLLGAKIGKTSISYLITIGKVAKIVSDSARKTSFRGRIINLENTNQAISTIQKIAKKNALVLVKGSRHAHLERIVYGLQGKSTLINCYHCGPLS